MTGILARKDLGCLFDTLKDDGYAVVGPTVRDGAIVYDTLDGPAGLPEGWTDEQSPGRYRLRRRDDDALFGYAVGPHSWKGRLFPAREVLHRTRKDGDGVHSERVAVEAPPMAYLGVRACELAAIAIQDRVFLGGPRVEPRYEARREAALFVAVSCGEPGGLCFCASTGTGPRVRSGADIVLTELPEHFVVEALTDRGRGIVARLPLSAAGEGVAAELDAVEARSLTRMGRTLDTENLPGLLFGNLDHPRWEEVAERCLSCGNCAMVCPTCFCSSVEEVSDLDATQTERVRVWDTCFAVDHGRIHGATFRPTTKDRYRQWLTHKFGSWVTQFGSSGCVGCGRCIAWCPVGIDVTEELGALRAGAAPPVRVPTPPPTETRFVDDLVPTTGTVVGVVRETADVVTLHVRADGVSRADHGQFNMVGLPGIGEVPISLSGTDGGTHVHTIRAVGAVTDALCKLAPGDVVQLRGPYGTTWPLDLARGRPVVIVAGGIGLAPLRTTIRAMLADPAGWPDVRVLYGARRPLDVLFPEELAEWARQARVEVTVDGADPSWRGHVGVVTRLLRPGDIPGNAIAFLCGPEVMMRFALQALAAVGVTPDRIYLSMERHMKCAAGFCGRCQYAHWFVCKDGPVFRADVLAPVFGHDGF